MKRGATLIELLLALAILAVLVGLALPKALAARDRGLVLLHAHRLATAHADTRSAARLAGGRAELVVAPSGYQQRQWQSGTLVATWTRSGPGQDALTLTGPTTPMIFDSRGFMLGAGNRTYVLTRGAASRQVIISRLGRLRIVP
jgi:prepilin-type N-terminal cleavage/methylation domain-containing protein